MRTGSSANYEELYRRDAGIQAENDYLLAGALLAGTDPDPLAEKSMSDEELDRKAAMDKASEELNRMQADDKNVHKQALCSYMAGVQENQRIQRDRRISTTSGKRMLAGALETLYRRALRLRKTAQAKDGGDI